MCFRVIITCEYFLDGQRPISQGWIFSTLQAESQTSTFFLENHSLGRTTRNVNKLQIYKENCQKNCHSLKVTNIYYLTKGIYCLVDFQGFWEVVHYSSSCMKGNRCGHKSLPRAGWRIGCGTVPWLPYYPDVEPEKNILIFFKFLFFLDFLTFRMLKASLWVTPLVDLPLMDSTRSPFCILPSRSANVPGMTLCTWKKLNFFYRDALTFHTKLKLNFLSKNSIWLIFGSVWLSLTQFLSVSFSFGDMYFLDKIMTFCIVWNMVILEEHAYFLFMAYIQSIKGHYYTW